MKSIVIVGANGFVGKHLVKQLITFSKYTIIGVDSKSIPHPSDFKRLKGKYQFCKTDISNECPRIPDNADIFAIVHLASCQPANASLTYRDYYKGNVETTEGVIALANKFHPKFVIFISTTTVYGNIRPREILCEATPINPLNGYGLTKFIAEKLLVIELAQINSKVIILRCPSLMGKNNPGGLISTYFELAKENKKIEIYSKGLRKRNILHVDDLVKTIKIILIKHKKLNKNELFVLGSRNSLTMLQIAKIIRNKTSSQSLIRTVSRRAPVDHDIIINTSKARRKLGFFPMTFENGLNRC